MAVHYLGGYGSPGIPPRGNLIGPPVPVGPPVPSGGGAVDRYLGGFGVPNPSASPAGQVYDQLFGPGAGATNRYLGGFSKPGPRRGRLIGPPVPSSPSPGVYGYPTAAVNRYLGGFGRP